MVHLPQISILGEKSLILFSSTFWQISFCQIFFFFYNKPRVVRMCHFWTQNGQICPNQNISENLLINFLFFMTTYIPKMKVSYQSIDEILMIKEYWNLIDREPFLAIITWEPYFSQVCSFPKILKNHTNFRFTTLKTWFSEKVRKALFFCPFWPFLASFFQKNSALSHITKYKRILRKRMARW